ncbi:TPR repeat-containing protein [Sesbania bispinosa]|nr:TPR repeat-containing protein [Sesbania bispinosa]
MVERTGTTAEMITIGVIIAMTTTVLALVVLGPDLGVQTETGLTDPSPIGPLRKHH